MANVRIYCVLILYTLVILGTANEPKVKKTLSVCKLTKGKNFDFPTKGAKGEKGDRGDPGKKGEQGFPGDKGPTGSQGAEGLRGPPGTSPQGDKGPLGPKGFIGEPGLSGETGPDGLKGEKGNKGILGSIGLPGKAGANGICNCPPPQKLNDDTELTGMCKDNPSVKTDNEYDIVDKNIAVECIVRDSETSLTCILPGLTSDGDTIKPKLYSFQNISSGFWLSSKNLTLEDLYGLNRTQIAWVQTLSNSAFQTLRFHCKNSVPFSRHAVDKSLLLLAWNDHTIGPVPTLMKPFFYSVENDGCSNNTNTWNYTDIKIVSDSARRLPIMDFFIRDVGNPELQEFKIEHIELCYD